MFSGAEATMHDIDVVYTGATTCSLSIISTDSDPSVSVVVHSIVSPSFKLGIKFATIVTGEPLGKVIVLPWESVVLKSYVNVKFVGSSLNEVNSSI